jgi:hypothetical protein
LLSRCLRNAFWGIVECKSFCLEEEFEIIDDFVNELIIGSKGDNSHILAAFGQIRGSTS